MQLVDLISEYFLNRTDKLANHAPWGKPCPIEVNGDLHGVLRAHLGESSHNARHLPANASSKLAAVDRVGSYTPAPDGTTAWLCFDCDGKGHPHALEDPLGVAEQIIQRLAAWDIPSHLERSGGGRGFHVWVFFDEFVTARAARLVGFEVLPEALLMDGRKADARRNQGLEVFPKTDDAVGDGFGNMIWLPWWSGAPQDCGEFYQFKDEQWTSYRPESFERARAARLRTIAESLQAAEKNDTKRKAISRPGTSSGWSEWRRDVLQRFDLRTVYGEWLTGKPTGKGWLECRDPGSPSGDRDPSASVADSAREAERGAFHSFREGRTLSVFDFLIEYGGCVDEMAAFRHIADGTGIDMPVPKRAERPEEPPMPNEPPAGFLGDEPPPASPDSKIPPVPEKPKLPEIIVNGRQMTDVIRDAWAAIRTCGKPKLYVRNHELVRIRRSPAGARIHAVDKDGAFGALARSARWVRLKDGKDGSYYVDVTPTHELAADLLSYPHPALPRLECVVQSPIFDYDGRLIDGPGFDEASGIYHDKQIEIPPVPEKPTSDDVLSARLLIAEDLFVDFPWCSKADYAAVMGALMLPFVRKMISSSTPIHLIEAPTVGSGKGLIADLICLIFTGRTADVMTLPQDDEESRKRITAILRLGKPIISFDNLPSGSKSAALAAALTAHTWADRVLGKSEIIEIPNRATWLITVNNPDFSVDLARRCIRIRIDPDEARPWERQEFKHPVIREWARDNRAELVHAVLTLIRYWVSEGMPRGDRILGSFDHWSRIIGGILDTIGIPGFLENASELYDQADTDSAEWMEFVQMWWARYEGAGVKASNLVEFAADEKLVPSIRGDRGSSSQGIRLGKALARMRGRVVGHWKIDRSFDSRTKSQMYKLNPIDDEGRQKIYMRED